MCRTPSRPTGPTCPEHALYLCGSPAMIGDMKALATQRGADPACVYVDGFTFQR
jgi:CDP-4-dehydro-6-deoxyglucose reductase